MAEITLVYIRHSKEASEYREDQTRERDTRDEAREETRASHAGPYGDWTMAPQNICLCLNPWNLWIFPVTLYDKNMIKDIERWSLSWIIQVGSECNHTYPYKTDTQRRWWKDIAARGWVTSQGMLAGTGNWKRQGMHYPLELPEGVQPWWYLDFDIWPSELWENKFLLFLSHQFMVICYGRSRKVIQALEVILRNMTYLPSDMGDHWRVLSSRTTWSDFCLKNHFGDYVGVWGTRDRNKDMS